MDNIVVLNCKVKETFERQLLVEKVNNDFYAYVLTGTDNSSAAMLSKVEDLSKVELEAAIGVDDYSRTELGIAMAKKAGIYSEDEVVNQLAEECEDLIEALPDDLETEKNKWYEMMQYMAFDMPADKVYEEIKYAKSHHNKFSEDFDPANVSVNADDLYCSAIGRLTRRQFGEYSEITLLSAINESKDMFISLMTQYRTLLARIIIDNKEFFDTWSDEKIRDYLTKIN